MTLTSMAPEPEAQALGQRPALQGLSTPVSTTSDEQVEETGPIVEEEQDDEVQSIIAVSISRIQSRLASPRTPAAERAAILQHIDSGDFFEAQNVAQTPPKLSHAGEKDDSDANVSSGSEELPSPWRASPKAFERTDEDGPQSQRKRATSASVFALPDLNLKKLVPFSVPSLPKVGNFAQYIPSPFGSGVNTSGDRINQTTTRPKRASTLFSYPASQWNAFSFNETSKRVQARAQDDGRLGQKSQILPLTLSNADGSSTLRDGKPSSDSSRPNVLRRATSDESLRISRSLSRVSSLGDDSKFNDVQSQVNSRLKAIKDSFADSSFKIQSKRLPHQNFRTWGISNSNLDKTGASDSNMPEKSIRRKFPSISAISMDTSLDRPPDLLQEALNQLKGDVVILGGYRGSILRSAKPPHRQVWAPVKVGLNLRKVDLEVGLTSEDERNMEKSIFSSGMLTHIGPVDISRRLIKRMKSCDNAKKGLLRVWDYGYDWRLSPDFLSEGLAEFLSRLPCNQSGTPPDLRGATVIAHSLGGVITRHVANKYPSLFRGILYAGVPQSCVNILGPLRNGDEVFLSSKVLTAQVNFTLRTSYALLPESGRCFYDKNTMEEYPIDFFDVKTWIEHSLTPCVNRSIPISESQTTIFGGLLESVSSSLPSLTLPGSRSSISTTNLSNNGRGSSIQKSSNSLTESSATAPSAAGKAAQAVDKATDGAGPSIAPQMGNTHSALSTLRPEKEKQSVATVCTIPLPDAIEYLERTLKEVLQFKRELAFRPEYEAANKYPPVAVIYGKTVPTVRGAKVDGREGIKYDNAYDDLLFGTGDGVVLAKEAMLPPGYTVARGGRVSSDRGHVTLLGDLDGVGRCLTALINARKRGVGVQDE